MPKAAPAKTRTPRFATAVKVKLSEKNKTLVSVADEMGVPHPRIRQWLKRNLFPESGLTQLAAAVGLPTNVEELQRTYGVRLTTHGKLKPATPSVAETIRYYLPELAKDDFGSDVKRFLRSMNEGEIFIVWSIDELAFEMRNVGWAAVGNAVASAIYQKGIFCIYVHPNDNELRRLTDGCGLARLPQAKFFETAFEQFKKNLILARELRDLNTDDLLLDAHGSRARLNNKQVDEHVVKISTANAAFCSPHHRYIIFISSANGTQKTPSALAQFPTGDSKSLRPTLLPLAEETTSDLYDFLISCLREEGPHRDAEIVKLLAPLPATDASFKSEPRRG